MPDEVEVTKESLLSLARDFDAGKSVDAPADTAPAADPVVKTDEPNPKPDDKKEVAEATPKASEADKTKSPKTDAEKQKSKWAQNEERKSKTWQEINADKEAIKAERENLQRERDEFRKAKALPAESLRDEHGATAKDYRKAAEQFKARGDTLHADAATAYADALDTQEKTQREQAILKEGAAKWQKNFTDLSVKHPDLLKADSQLSQAALKVLETFPALRRDPDGIKYAVRAAEIELQAREFDGTKAQLAKLQAEHEKLQKKLSISGGSPTATLPESKSFKDMSLKEQRASLEQQVAQHDRDNGL